MIVLKYGGSTIYDAAGFHKAVDVTGWEITQEQRRSTGSHAPLVVVSALNGTTRKLTRAAEFRRDGSSREASRLFDEITEDHLAIGEELRLPRKVMEEVRREFEQAKSAKLNGSFPAYKDVVMAAGELASSRMFAAALKRAGIDAGWIDARDVVITNDAHTEAEPDWRITEANAKAYILPTAEEGIVSVMGGFIGKTPAGETTTIGLEGSDLSATLVGACLGVREVHIYKDVAGICDRDPKEHPDARLITTMSYDDADRFAHARKMIHPQTIKPLIAKGITLVIKGIKDPSQPGTRIGN